MQFENHWLGQYPCPTSVIYNQGGEFLGTAFQNCLCRHNIQGCVISNKNPQANSVCERAHQTIGNSLQALTTLQPPQGIILVSDLVDTAIANAVFAVQLAYSAAIGTTPGALAFYWDMVLAIPIAANLSPINYNINNSLTID